MPLFGKEVDAFIDTVLEHWDDLYSLDGFSELCDALYELYHTETAVVAPAKSELEFGECIKNLMAYHKRYGGTVKLNQHGYHEFWTDWNLVKPPSEKDATYRIYVNASTKNVIVLGRILVHEVCQTGTAMYFKIATSAKAVDQRKDAIVIYLFGKKNAETIARKLGQITGGMLTPTVPGLTREIASGISVAEDPASFSDSVSFGQSRVRPFATALRCYRDDFAKAGLLDDLTAEDRYEVFARLLTGAFRAYGINPLNPSEVNNVISKGKDVAASTISVPTLDKKGALYYARTHRAKVQ